VVLVYAIPLLACALGLAFVFRGSGSGRRAVRALPAAAP
jgi:hypothetical protein